MADDNQDQEVENILSSIKDILEADEGDNKTEPLPMVGGEDSNVLDEVLNEDMGDDVLELSQDMRIDVAEPVAEDHEVNAETITEIQPENTIAQLPMENEVAEVSLDEAVGENNEADPVIAENVVEQPEEPVAMPEISETVDEIPVINEIQEVVAPEPIVENMEDTTIAMAEETAIAEDNAEVSEPISESLGVVEELPQIEPIEEENSEVEVGDAVEPVQEEVVQAEPVVEEIPAIEQVEEMPVQAISMQEPMVEEVVEPVTAIQEIEEPKAEIEPTSDPVDASANIISNFAKMFAKGKQEQELEAKEPITAMGNGAHTLEDFVKEAIIRVIGDEIVKKWNNGAEYQSMAEAEIKNQVQTWVNTNLPAMVEKIVKEEMERVIAKVGS